MELERVALTDPYFVDRKLYPNVDFYSGLIYKAMGFPTDMFPVLFAIPRTAGWLAHWYNFSVFHTYHCMSAINNIVAGLNLLRTRRIALFVPDRCT